MIETLSRLASWITPFFMLGIPLFGVIKKVKVYDVFLEGALEGFKIIVKLLPFYVAIFTAVALIKESGMLDIITKLLGSSAEKYGLTGEIIAQALMKPISGSASLGIAANTMTTYGPDSFLGRLSSIIQGSTDTTFFVIALYYGSIKVTKVKHTLWAGLLSDAMGFVAAVILCKMLF